MRAFSSNSFSDLEEKKKEKTPEFKTLLKDATGIDGESTKFTCRVAAYPAPEVTWFYYGTALSSDDKFTISFDGTEATLAIPNTKMEDTGKYTCKVCLRLRFLGTKTIPMSLFGFINYNLFLI